MYQEQKSGPHALHEEPININFAIPLGTFKQAVATVNRIIKCRLLKKSSYDALLSSLLLSIIYYRLLLLLLAFLLHYLLYYYYPFIIIQLL